MRASRAMGEGYNDVQQSAIVSVTVTVIQMDIIPSSLKLNFEFISSAEKYCVLGAIYRQYFVRQMYRIVVNKE